MEIDYKKLPLGDHLRVTDEEIISAAILLAQKDAFRILNEIKDNIYIAGGRTTSRLSALGFRFEHGALILPGKIYTDPAQNAFPIRYILMAYYFFRKKRLSNRIWSQLAAHNIAYNDYMYTLRDAYSLIRRAESEGNGLSFIANTTIPMSLRAAARKCGMGYKEDERTVCFSLRNVKVGNDIEGWMVYKRIDLTYRKDNDGMPILNVCDSINFVFNDFAYNTTNHIELLNGYMHPHISGNNICYGNRGSDVGGYAANEQYSFWCATTKEVVSVYNPDNPYQNIRAIAQRIITLSTPIKKWLKEGTLTIDANGIWTLPEDANPRICPSCDRITDASGDCVTPGCRHNPTYRSSLLQIGHATYRSSHLVCRVCGDNHLNLIRGNTIGGLWGCDNEDCRAYGIWQYYAEFAPYRDNWGSIREDRDETEGDIYMPTCECGERLHQDGDRGWLCISQSCRLHNILQLDDMMFPIPLVQIINQINNI